jgi:DNA-binding CsgD family transcriptional regulator
MNFTLENLAAIIAAILASPAPPARPVLRALDRLAVCAFIATDSGAVRELNASAHASMPAIEALSSNARDLDVLRAATGEQPCGAAMSLEVPSRGACDVTVSPLEARLALVMIAPGRRTEGPALEQMRRGYGLTEAEARVLGALARGATVSEIALEHGVSASTVRAQVRSLFEKTGVNRQSDLVRLALTPPRAANEPIDKRPGAVALSRWRL